METKKGKIVELFHLKVYPYFFFFFFVRNMLAVGD